MTADLLPLLLVAVVVALGFRFGRRRRPKRHVVTDHRARPKVQRVQKVRMVFRCRHCRKGEAVWIDPDKPYVWYCPNVCCDCCYQAYP